MSANSSRARNQIATKPIDAAEAKLVSVGLVAFPAPLPQKWLPPAIFAEVGLGTRLGSLRLAPIMASPTDGESMPVFGQFHQKCGEGVVLSEGRRVASVSMFGPFPIAFSNDPIPKGVQFSVKVLQEGRERVIVSPLIQTSCSLRCMPCLDSAHMTTVNSQLVSRRSVRVANISGSA